MRQTRGHHEEVTQTIPIIMAGAPVALAGLGLAVSRIVAAVRKPKAPGK